MPTPPTPLPSMFPRDAPTTWLPSSSSSLSCHSCGVHCVKGRSEAPAQGFASSGSLGRCQSSQGSPTAQRKVMFCKPRCLPQCQPR